MSNYSLVECVMELNAKPIYLHSELQTAFCGYWSPAWRWTTLTDHVDMGIRCKSM